MQNSQLPFSSLTSAPSFFARHITSLINFTMESLLYWEKKITEVLSMVQISFLPSCSPFKESFNSISFFSFALAQIMIFFPIASSLAVKLLVAMAKWYHNSCADLTVWHGHPFLRFNINSSSSRIIIWPPYSSI